MKYIVCEKPGVLVLKEADVPLRKEGEVLLQVNKIGVCGTDLHAFGGNQPFFTYPRILGHEIASEVMEADKDSTLKPGGKVAVIPYLHCGKCLACRKGKTNCCREIRVFGVHIDGGMKEKIVLPEKFLIPVPGLSDKQIAILEPLAIGTHAIRRAKVTAGERIVVVGCGPIGIGILELARLRGADVIAMDINEERLQFVKDRIGIEKVVKAGDTAASQVAAFTDGDLADVVFDATGNKKAIESGVDYMAHGGRYALVGLYKGDLNFNHPRIHARETTLLCCRNATPEDFEHVISVIDRFPVDAYVTHECTLQNAVDNFKVWTNPKQGVIKGIINFKK